MLVLGAALLLAAFLGERLLGSVAGTGAGVLVRGIAAVAGLALIVWTAAPFMQRAHPSAAPAAVSEHTGQIAHPTSLPGDAVRVATAALEDCFVASAPTMPDGTRASKQEMLTARSAFEAYDAATNKYTQCVDATIESVTNRFPGASQAELQTLRDLGDGAHNTAVDQEQSFAEQFNTQVRAFNAKHPKG
jgi:hypothetical protein